MFTNPKYCIQGGQIEYDKGLNCGQSYDKVMSDMERDYWMSAEEAVKYGIVDAIANKF